MGRSDFRLWLHFCSDSLRLKFSLKNKEAETVKKVRENETADSGGNRLQVCFPPLLMLICACPSFLSCSMLNWRNVVCVDFYTADVQRGDDTICRSSFHFHKFSLFFEDLFPVCLHSNQVPLFDFYNMTYPQRPWLWVSLLLMTLESRGTMNHILWTTLLLYSLLHHHHIFLSSSSRSRWITCDDLMFTTLSSTKSTSDISKSSPRASLLHSLFQDPPQIRP